MAIDTLLQNGIAGLELKHAGAEPRTSQRKLGETEISYYLPSRDSGVNDMYVACPSYHAPLPSLCRYLHLGFHASPKRVTPNRILLTWAILRSRHPLLAARVEMNAYDDIHFV